jgi:predicted small secreted protein
MKKVLAIVAFFAVVAVVSSCNRGVGCPTNFSAQTK